MMGGSMLNLLRAFVVAGVFVAIEFVNVEARADEKVFDAAALFKHAVVENLRLSDDGKAIELESGVLVEDDGPAAGYSYQPNEEKLSAGIAVRKQLVIDDPRAKSATLLVGGSGMFQFEINGKSTELKTLGKSGNYWEMFELPVGKLKKGVNDIVLRGQGKLWIARDDEYFTGSLERRSHPNRSAKSSDDGKTWNDRQLGTKNDVDGEYYVRVFLDQRRRQGTLITPVIDLCNLAEASIAPAVESLGSLEISTGSGGDANCKVTMQFRSSPSPSLASAEWSPWSELPIDFGEATGSNRRYVQFRFQLSTSESSSSPQLLDLALSSSPEVSSDWIKNLRVVETKNASIVRSSVPFEYERFDHLELKNLREQHKLDDVVKDAETEWEIIRRLAVWSSTRFQKGHLSKVYPAWNALEILKPYEDGTPVGGFCQQYNLLLLQACESFGIVGRMVSIGPGDQSFPVRGGHEVVELWSNEFNKWTYVDGNEAWYAIDQQTKLPLSLVELHDRQLAHLKKVDYRPIEIVTLAERERKWTSLSDWPPFVEMRLIPRSNFLEKLSPRPLNQGMRGWFWTGHYAWSDAAAPAALLYGHRVSRVEDWQWTLNQSRIDLEATSTPSELRVHLDTVTPSFDMFVAKLDDGEWQKVSSGFSWKLHTGKNRLEVKSRNTAGREGAASYVVIERP